MTIFGRGAFLKTTESLCRRYRFPRVVDIFEHNIVSLKPSRRPIHTTPSPRGLLGYLVGDHHYARLHKAISGMLQDYDTALYKYYKNATEAYHNAYLTGARADLIKAFEQTGALYRLTSRMKTYVNTNDLLKQTALPDIFHQGKLQQKVDAFLEVMQEKYGDDKQYKHVIEEIKKDKIEPVQFESPLKGTKLVGLIVRTLDWLRDHEIQQLREQYEQAQNLFENARSTGRRRDIDKALKAADRLQEVLEKRYEGKLWHEEKLTGEIDSRLKRTDENLAVLEKLKGDIGNCIEKIRQEFESASKNSSDD